MNTSLKSRVGKLAVDWESGLVIRADDQAEVTQKWLELHPFVIRDGGVVRAGRGPTRATYEVQADVAGLLTLQKVENA